MKRKSTFVMFGALLLFVWVAFAQTLDPSLPLWGWHWAEISFLLGAIAPFLNSFIAKSEWVSEHKEYLIASISLIFTVAVGFYLKTVTAQSFSGDQIIATFLIILGMSQVVYKALKGFFQNLTANVGNGATTKKN